MGQNIPNPPPIHIAPEQGGGFNRNRVAKSAEYAVVAKKYGNILHWVKECMSDDSFEPFYPGGGIEGASFIYRMKTWARPYEFSSVRRLTDQGKDAQGLLFPK